MEHTYYSKKVLREVFPSLIVTDVINMIEKYLHQKVREHALGEIPRIVNSMIDIQYVNMDFLIEDFVKKFYVVFGYSIRTFSQKVKDYKPAYRSASFIEKVKGLCEKLKFGGGETNYLMKEILNEFLNTCVFIAAKEEGLFDGYVIDKDTYYYLIEGGIWNLLGSS
jgi:hypothetical protein